MIFSRNSAPRWARTAAAWCAALVLAYCNRKRRQARELLWWVERNAVQMLFSATIMLALLGFAKLYTTTNDLRSVTQHLATTQQQLQADEHTLAAQQASECQLRRSGRLDSNEHLRAPLRGMATYLGSLALAGAAKQKDPAAKQAATTFGETFLGYAAKVKSLPNPQC